MVFLGRISSYVSMTLSCCIGIAEVEEYIAPNGECVYMCFDGKPSGCITGPYDNVVQIEIAESEHEKECDCCCCNVSGRGA